MGALIAAPSPNHNDRYAPPDVLVLHYTGMPSGQAALERLQDPEAKVSAHYLVEEDGRIFALVAEERRAWHAGVAYWRGERDINDRSIGVEIVNPGHEFGYRPFPPAQIAAVIGLLGEIRARWAIPDNRILGHSDVAPERKQDPGELFPWRTLAMAGHGLWTDEPGGAEDDSSPQRAQGEGLGATRRALAAIGYEPAIGGAADAAMTAQVIAFQRHWSPHRVDGLVDRQTLARLEAIAALSQRA